MVCETSLLTAPVVVSSAKEGGASVSASLLASAPKIEHQVPAAAKVATTILCSLFLVAAAPVEQMVIETEIIMPITRSQLRSNFITLDDCYVMTADGRIFFVQED